MKVKYQGRDVEAVEVDVLTTDEKWNTYQLGDGKILIFKDVLVSVIKLVGETGPDGNQLYQFNTHRVVRVK